MRFAALPGAVALLALMGLGTTALRAQDWTYGAAIADLTWNNFDIAGGCNENRGASPGASLFVGRRIAAGLSVVATGRLHYSWPSIDLLCAEPFGPRVGTSVFETGGNPLVHTFVATDLRLEYAPRLPRFAPMLAFGGGSVFWNGAPAPYGLVAGGLGLRTRPMRVSLIAEYQRLGLKLDRVQQTFAAGPTPGFPELISQTDLGYSRFWKTARLLALRFDFAVRTPR